MSVKSEILDYVAHFKNKSWRERRKAIKRHLVQLIVVIGLIGSPAIIMKIHNAIERKIHSRYLDGLSVRDKWEAVKMGLVHVECADDAPEKLAEAGLDASKPDAITYAIDNGICTFVPNDEAEFSQFRNNPFFR